MIILKLSLHINSLLFLYLLQIVLIILFFFGFSNLKSFNHRDSAMANDVIK